MAELFEVHSTPPSQTRGAKASDRPYLKPLDIPQSLLSLQDDAEWDTAVSFVHLNKAFLEGMQISDLCCRFLLRAINLLLALVGCAMIVFAVYMYLDVRRRSLEGFPWCAAH